MRDFKNPTYDGPDCVCCHNIKEDTIKGIIEMLEEQESVCADWVIALLKKDIEE